MFSSNATQVNTSAIYVENVFSTYLYTGNTPNSQTISNGINLGPDTGNSNYFNAGQINTEQSASAFDLGTSDWTVECWIKTSYTSRIDPFELNGGTSSGFFGLTLNSSASGYIEWNESSGGSSVAVITATGTTVANGSWHNIAITRSGNSVRLFFDGTQVGSTYTTSYTYGGASKAFRFGNRYPGGISSSSVFYISNFRIVKGTALYTTTFTPSTQPLTQISGTSYLGAQSSYSLVDTTLIGNSYTNNVTPGATGPFNYGTGNGGLVWLKRRNVSNPNLLGDTVRGVGLTLISSSDNGNSTESLGFTAFNSDSFTVGPDVNYNSGGMCSWTFREQPKFFDIVTWTGNGANRTISHLLGSVPGCIMVKRTDTTGDWQVYHSALANTQYMVLNTTAAVATGATRWNSTTPTSTVFSVGTESTVNASGGTYIAYIFASNAGGFGLTGADNVISCGSYSGSGVAGNVISLGFEAQWVLIRRTDVVQDWFIFDTMRGMCSIGSGNSDPFLNPNTSNSETAGDYVGATATGFVLKGITSALNASGGNYIYIAIRRGPMAVPTIGTSVYSPIAVNNSTGTQNTTNFPVDTQIARNLAVGQDTFFYDRLRGVNTTDVTDASPFLTSVSTAAESSALNRTRNWGSTGYFTPQNFNGVNAIYWNLRRSPSVFDVVCYTGTGSNTTQTHNLNVVPEMMIVKTRSSTGNWAVYHKNLTSAVYTVWLNLTSGESNQPTMWNSTAPTSTVFSVGTSGDTNANGDNYVAYLFATCAGVSKVGSYTGTATTNQINCGFTGGARFVLIKRTDSTGDWYVWDSARGIVAGNDPYVLINSTAAEVTGTDYVDTYSAGFEISSTAPAAINASGGTFIFLAIA